jgi:hypothetical protein
MQRQPNGNTLITEGTDGRIFEVSTDGDIVWDYINPVIGNGPLTQGEPVPPNMNNPDWFRNLLFRSYRYPLDYPAFLGKDLSPKGTVEATPTAIASNFDVPEGFSLAQNYPNPFNPTTTLAFTLPQAGTVTLSVYNTLGQRVATVAERGFSQGTHTVRFEAGGLPSGVYLYRLEGDGFTATRRMMLVK